MVVEFKRIPTQGGFLVDVPVLATSGSAGADLCASLDNSVILPPGGTVLIPTGIAMAVPQGYAAFVFARSGLGIKHGISPANAVGVIDSDYRGEIQVGLHNKSQVQYTVNPGDRIAQLIIMPVAAFELAEADLDKTGRGSGGFGSTGR